MYKFAFLSKFKWNLKFRPLNPDQDLAISNRALSFILVLESTVFMQLLALSDAGIGPELCWRPADDSRALGCGVPRTDGLSRAPYTRLRCCLSQVRLNSPCVIPSYLTKSERGPPSSVADPDPGSGASLTSGSGIQNRFFPGSRIDPGSQTHIFESLVTFFG